ncbi:MAG TPA: SAM-dependent methyltransferase [Thermomicrobiales bacterium]|nr:SAM-dependent methyltransferase [Thermomicrobiales bacterium]
MGEHDSLPAGYFERVYAENDDPWGFATRPYEARKYGATLAALPREHYRSAFEIGCSIGVLTEQLATRCDRLLAVDVAERALALARRRCRHLPHVRFDRMAVPARFPAESFDLILVSEVGYYWGWNDLRRAQRLIVEHLVPAGQLLLVHWTPYVADYPLTGDQVHEAFLNGAKAGNRLHHLVGSRQQTYRLDLFERDG